jgi:hypothetical protein
MEGSLKPWAATKKYRILVPPGFTGKNRIAAGYSCDVVPEVTGTNRTRAQQDARGPRT